MCNQTYSPSPYPSGHIEYQFDMHVFYDTEIPCTVRHPKVRDIVLKKVNPSDKADTKWSMTIFSGEVFSVEEVDKIGEEIKNDIFDTLAFSLQKNKWRKTCWSQRRSTAR